MKGKRGLAIILTLSMLMYLLTGFGPAVMAADARFAAEKPFEAENGKLSGAMKKTKDTGASGGYFISVTEGARVDEPAKMRRRRATCLRCRLTASISSGQKAI